MRKTSWREQQPPDVAVARPAGQRSAPLSSSEGHCDILVGVEELHRRSCRTAPRRREPAALLVARSAPDGPMWHRTTWRGSTPCSSTKSSTSSPSRNQPGRWTCMRQPGLGLGDAGRRRGCPLGRGEVRADADLADDARAGSPSSPSRQVGQDPVGDLLSERQPRHVVRLRAVQVVAGAGDDVHAGAPGSPRAAAARSRPMPSPVVSTMVPPPSAGEAGDLLDRPARGRRAGSCRGCANGSCFRSQSRSSVTGRVRRGRRGPEPREVVRCDQDETSLRMCSWVSVTPSSALSTGPQDRHHAGHRLRPGEPAEELAVQQDRDHEDQRPARSAPSRRRRAAARARCR